MDYSERVPDAVVRRLPGYYRHLRELETAGLMRLSSRALGERMGLTASQIRQDINYFGDFGQQGYGYHVPSLRRCIGQILGVDREHRMVIAGAGSIGTAVARYPAFQADGFRLVALFDIDERRIGMTIAGAPVLHIDDMKHFLPGKDIEILVLATPPGCAQQIVDVAAAYGIRAVWNFVPIDLSVQESIELANVRLTDSLFALSFRLHEREVRAQTNPAWVKESE
ncbi:MAG: redox-sensing transcriptional repressor Rex [Clostridia bacterium]|nr:redox-sensing transcriptional repressor Rex [Clostridia bacterium]